MDIGPLKGKKQEMFRRAGSARPRNNVIKTFQKQVQSRRKLRRLCLHFLILFV